MTRKKRIRPKKESKRGGNKRKEAFTPWRSKQGVDDMNAKTVKDIKKPIACSIKNSYN